MSATNRDRYEALRVQLKDRLVQNIEAVVTACGVDMAGRDGQDIWLVNPNSGNATSLKVTVSGPHAGHWIDFSSAGGTKSGALGGDMLSFIAHFLYGDVSKSGDAWSWALKFTGLSNEKPPNPDEAARLKREAEARRARQEREERIYRRQKAGKAFAVWNNVGVPFRGTVVETYLRSRMIDPDKVGPMTATRLGPDQKYRRADGSEILTPAMFNLMVRVVPGGTPEWAGLHKTYLQPDGRDRRREHRKQFDKDGRVIKPQGFDKGMFGDVAGGAIRVSKGPIPKWQSLEDYARKTGEFLPLILTEGFENACVAAMAYPDHLCWATGSIVQIGNVVLPPCVDVVKVFGDNDEKPKAREALERAVSRLWDRREGREVTLARPKPPHNDLNDWWIAKNDKKQ